MIFHPHNYQIGAAVYLANNPYCALLADPGTGKTAIVLAIVRGLTGLNPEYRSLVIAPKRVIYEVWPQEIAKWDQFAHLTYEVLHGRKKAEAAERPANIHLLNVDGIKWAASRRLFARYDAVFFDESSKLKNWTSKRMLTLKRYLPLFNRRHILTGSPVPQSLQDYFSQQYLVDCGHSLGHAITSFRQRYFYNKASPYQSYPMWEAREGALDEVLAQVGPFAYRLDGERLLDLPDIQVNDIEAPIAKAKEYKELVKDADSAGAGYALSRQLANGYLSPGSFDGLLGDTSVFHTQKMEMLETLVAELNGNPALVFFNFRGEGEAIARKFGCPLVYGGTPDRTASKIVRQWNKGEHPLVALNPATTGHGLNLQDGGYHQIWFSLPTNQDDWYQAIRRLRRQGQKSKTVFVHRLLMRGTVDTALVSLLEGKTDAQQQFLDGIRGRNPS